MLCENDMGWGRIMGGVTGGIVKELSACLNLKVECLPQRLNLKALSEIAFEGWMDFQISILLISESYQT